MQKKAVRSVPHADRYVQINATFLRFLERFVPGFKYESFSVRLALCSMIFEAPTRYRAHSHHEGHARFTWQELEQSFGRSGFRTINARLNLFELLKTPDGRDDWSKTEGRTKAYALTDKVTTLREQFLEGCLRRGHTKLLTQDGKELRNLPASAMAAKNKDGQNRRGFQNLPVNTLVPVNLVQIKKLIVDIEARLFSHESGAIQSELYSQVPNVKFLRALRQDAQMLIAKARNEKWPGQVFHRYREIESGRVYAEGVANLQTCYRVLREAAMAGAYDLDIENCHYDILAQMAATYGYQCTAIQSYLDDKKTLRSALSHEFGITVRQAKDSLIALIYGAKFSVYAQDALPQIFKSTKLAAKIYQHPQFRALRDDIAGARKTVLSAQNISRRTMQNCLGLTIRLDITNERQQLAHLLQGVEVTALEAAYRLYPNEIVLLQHDGFAATSPLDTKRIEDAIQEATGYRLEVRQTPIQVNLGDAFDAHPDHHEPADNQIDRSTQTQHRRGLPEVCAPLHAS